GAVGVRDITEPDGTKHTALTVTPHKDGGMVVSIMSEGKYLQRSGSVKFAGRPREAPVLNFNAPGSIRFTSAVCHPVRGRGAPPERDVGHRPRLPLGKDIPVPGGRAQGTVVSLSAIMGTPGLGEGSFVTYKARDIQGQNNPQVAVEVTFPNRDPR